MEDRSEKLKMMGASMGIPFGSTGGKKDDNANTNTTITKEELKKEGLNNLPIDLKADTFKAVTKANQRLTELGILEK